MSAEISVALCTFNGAAFVGEQVRSILEQRRPADEIVVSDDGSSDDTLEIVGGAIEASVAAGAPRPAVITLTEATPAGVTANFERAVSASTGALIALSDQDDVWYADRLDRLAAVLDDQRITFVHTNARLVDELGEPLGRSLFESLEVTDGELALEESGRAFDALLRRNLATGATVVFRRSLLEYAKPFPPTWVHDEWLAIVAAATGRLSVVREPTIDYRQHTSNQIGVAEPTLRRKLDRVFEPRGERNATLAARFALLADRLASLGPAVSASDLESARQKARFEAARAAMPSNRLRRVGTVFALDRKGLYARFASRGRADIVRDLLQPA